MSGQGAPVAESERAALEREAAVLGSDELRGAFRGWRRLILLLPLVGAAIGVVDASRTSQSYAATAIVLLSPDSGVFGNGASDQPERRIETEAELLSSPEVRAQLEDEIGRSVQYSVRAGTRTNVLSITSSAAAPREAAEQANLVAETYIATRRAMNEERVEEAVTALRDEITAVEAELADIEDDIDGGTGTALQLARRAALSQQVASLETRMNELEIESRAASGAPHLAARAVTPETLGSKGVTKNAVGGFLAGTALAVLLVLLLNRARLQPDRRSSPLDPSHDQPRAAPSADASVRRAPPSPSYEPQHVAAQRRVQATSAVRAPASNPAARPERGVRPHDPAQMPWAEGRRGPSGVETGDGDRPPV